MRSDKRQEHCGIFARIAVVSRVAQDLPVDTRIATQKHLTDLIVSPLIGIAHLRLACAANELLRGIATPIEIFAEWRP